MTGLLLSILVILAAFGSCHPPDPVNSPGHYLVSRTTVKSCAAAKDDWLVGQFESCDGDPIIINGGKGTIDVSTWAEEKVAKIFVKYLDGGFTIRNSQFVGTDIGFNMKLLMPVEDDVNLTVANNPQLTHFFLDVYPNSKAPRVRISGNRLLNKKNIEFLNELLTFKKIRADSHIQIYQECDLEGKPVDNVAATLKDCKAIYGDLVFDASSKFPADMKSIEKLAYVQGCLRITGTQFKSWNELTFLEGTKSKEGGCTSGHEISGNSAMCIHPPEAEKLKAIFRDMTIANNQACTPECTSRHVLDKEDSTCEIITDSLIIDDKATYTSLGALQNVKEIKGLLQVVKTQIKDFNYLPKLTKLNSNNMSAAGVIALQSNPQMTRFDLPQLQASGVGTGRDGQIIIWTEKNGPEGNFKGDDAFLKRVDPGNSRMAVPTVQAVATTTEKAVPRAKEIDTIDVIKHNIVLIIFTGIIAPLILVILFVVACFLHSCGILTMPRKWKSHPMEETVEQTDIYQYSEKNDFIQLARHIVEENKPKIEAANKRHRDNRDYKLLSVLNHNATTMMPGLFQWKDYDQNKELRKTEKKDINTMSLLAPQMNGLYGLAFDAAIGYKYPPEFKYRTQCDLFSLGWFESGLPPIYVEKFASTAKRMCHMPCDMISENLRYLRSKSIKIPEYGITSKGFQTETGLFGKLDGPRKAEEKEDLIWIKDKISSFKFYRYREKMNELGANPYPKKFFADCKKNLHQFVIRMVEMMMSMPVGHVLDLKASDVVHFLRILYPSVIGKAHGFDTKYPRSPMSAGGYSVEMNRTHVRIVGELRGDFDALRRAINIPSLLDGKDHPMLQYNWLFLGNYTGRHPQSLETIMFLLALQFLYGRDCIVLLRGVMEFSDTNKEYGFKENLEKRFGKKKGGKLHVHFMKVFARLPLNCRVLHAVYCCSGGFNDGDIVGKDKDAPLGKFNEKATLQSLNKIFSLPNYTVRDYFENVDTGAGYYYGERTLQKIAEDTEMYTFFSTGPMTGGVGYFCDTSAAQLFMLSSVKGLHGHGGMVTQLAAVAELNGQTGRVTFHMMLEEDQMVYYDTQRMELRSTPFEEEEGGPPKKKTTTSTETGTPTGESTTPAVTKTTL